MKKVLGLMILFSLIAGGVLAAYAGCPLENKTAPTGPAPVAFDKAQPEGTAATCPVTGEKFKIAKDNSFSEYKGKFYYFCCSACKPKFDADPEKYLQKK